MSNPQIADATDLFAAVPDELKQRHQWVLWKEVPDGDKPRKVPKQSNGRNASSTDPATWSTFAKVAAAYDPAKHSGLGYMFAADDPYCGVDFDDVIDGSGKISPKAAAEIEALGGYAEISPSGTGVKVWVRATLKAGGKRPFGDDGSQIEAYDHGRFFTVTGRVLPGHETIGDDAQKVVDALCQTYGIGANTAAKVDDYDDPSSIAPLALALDLDGFLDKLPEAVSGDRGSDRTIEALCAIRRAGFYGDDGFAVATRWNDRRATPPWTEPELRRKWDAARLMQVPAGHEFPLIDTPPEVAKPKSKSTPPSFAFAPVDFVDFIGREFDEVVVVENCLTQGEHGVIGGGKKCLKTLLGLDLSISVATGAPFLGHFPVRKSLRTAFLTGETGQRTIKRRSLAIATARGVEVPRGRLFFKFELPKLYKDGDLAALEAGIELYEIELCILDPAYLCTLGAGQHDVASSIHGMGAQLGPLSEIGRRTGCTMILQHHARKMAKGHGQASYRPMDLDDLSGSGFAEWSRQWLLIARQSRYQPGSGKHDLYLSTGGSAGFGGEFVVHVNEGDSVTGDLWDVTVGQGAQLGDQAKIDEREDRVMKALAIAEGGFMTENGLRTELKVGQRTLLKIVDPMVERGEVVLTTHGTAKRYSLATRGGQPVQPV